MSKLTLEDKLRCQHVARWQTVRVARVQNVAEHSWAVAVLAEHILTEATSGDQSDLDMLALYKWSLHHDVLEVVTGDLNTLIKIKMRLIFGEASIDSVESEVCEDYTKLKACTPPLIKDIVKMADLIEAHRFLKLESIGSHSHNVANKILEAMVVHGKMLMITYPHLQWENALGGLL
jgi:5'-deoxynucleotidase YfbR-like HD superfamily hydrolase